MSKLGCSGDRACPWPVERDGLCAQHLKDQKSATSMTGSTMQLFFGLETYNWKAKYGSLSKKPILNA